MAVTSSTKRVLIVDDEEAIVTLIRDVLLNFNYEPLVATRWTEAVDAIANQAPDLILLDLKMPTIDGSSLLEFIRDEGNQVPVIIVSGFITDEVAQNLSKFGVSGFVRKPFKVSQLKDQVDRVLGVESVAAPPPQADTGSDEDESAAPPEPSTAKAPPESSPTASKPASIGSLYEDSEEESDPIEATPATPAQAPSEEEVLQILQKLDAPKTKPQPAAPPPPAPPPAKASEPTSEAPPPIPPPDPVAQAPDLTAAGQPGPAPEPVGEGHPEERRHRTHHRRHRSRRISRRSVLIYSAITVVCVIVAGFLAAIHWWESQGGLTEIQTKAGSAVKEQLKQELLKELQNQKR